MKIIYKERPVSPQCPETDYIVEGRRITRHRVCPECTKVGNLCETCKTFTPAVVELNISELGNSNKATVRRFYIEKMADGNVLIDFRILGDQLLSLQTSDDPNKKLTPLLVRYVYKTGKSHLAEINPHEKYPDTPVLLGFDITPDGRFINLIAIDLPFQVFQKTYQPQMKDIFQNLFPKHYSSKHRYCPQVHSAKPNIDKPPMILESKMGKWTMLTLFDELEEGTPDCELIMRNEGKLNQIQSRAMESRPESMEFLHIKPTPGSSELVYFYVVVSQYCHEMLLFKLTVFPSQGKSTHEQIYKTQALWNPVCPTYQTKLFDAYKSGTVILPYQRTVTILNRGKDKFMQIAIKPAKKAAGKKNKD